VLLLHGPFGNLGAALIGEAIDEKTGSLFEKNLSQK
jgi:hypothetical protein